MDWCTKQYRMKVKELSFYFNPWTIEYNFAHYQIHYISRVYPGYTKQLRFSFNSKNKILNLLENVIGEEISIYYYMNLKEERKLKLENLEKIRN